MKKELYIIAGHNGAGKTTFLKQFVKQRDLKYINADEIAQKFPQNRLSLLSIKAGKRAFKKLKDYNKKQISFAIETTLSGKVWRKIISDFKKDNYNVTLYFIYLDTPEEAIRRISVRKNKNGHYVSDNVVDRRYFRSIKNFWLIYKELVDKWFLMNNSGDTPFWVASGKRKDINIIDKDNFDKFMSIAKGEKNEK